MAKIGRIRIQEEYTYVCVFIRIPNMHIYVHVYVCMYAMHRCMHLYIQACVFEKRIGVGDHVLKLTSCV